MKCVYTRKASQKVVIALLLLSMQVSVLIAFNGEALENTTSLANGSNNVFGEGYRPLPLQNNTWKNVTTGFSPPPRDGHAMAYDSKRGRIVMFGGAKANILNDTWIFETATGIWTNVSPAHSPPPRTSYKLAYDSESDRVVLFGGWLGGKSTNDTWSYNPGLNTWTKMEPKEHPSSCYDYGMAYDSGSDRVVLFGGRCVDYVSKETWSYDYNRDEWRSMGPAYPPIERIAPVMTYDLRSDRVILFDGFFGTTFFHFNETWSYDLDHNTWSNQTTDKDPPPLRHPSMSYDTRSDRVVLFGNSEGCESPDTWLYDYDTNSWANATTSTRPLGRSQAAMTYDPVIDRIVLFGGYGSRYPLNDTWTYELSNTPYVERTSPSKGVLDPSVSSDVVIAFSEQMDRKATEGAIALTPSIRMNASWDASVKVLTLSPMSSFEPGANIAIRISTNATSVDGHGMRYEFAFSFVIFKPAPLPPVDAGTVVAVIGMATIATLATALYLSEWLLYASLILLMPLYMKVRKEKVLDNFMRGRIYQFIIHCPGAHLRFIGRTLDVEMGVLCYHLKILEKSGFIRSDKRGNLKRFFCTSRQGGSGMNEYQFIQKEILTELNHRPGQGIRSLSTILNKDRQVVTFCVHDLLDKKAIIDKRTVRGVMFHPRGQTG